MVNVGRVTKSVRLGAQTIYISRYSGEWLGGEYVCQTPEKMEARGIITLARPKDINMLPEGDRVLGGIRVLTTIPLMPTNPNGTGDIITWRGAQYKVMTVSPDIDYGFFRSICTRLDGDGIG